MSELNLTIAVGDKQVEPDDRRMVLEPFSRGRRHAPMAHAKFFDNIETQLKAYGLEMEQHVHALSRDSNRYFGMAEIASNYTDYTSIVGWRSCHDQRYAASLVSGSGVFVCSNLCFSGEVQVARKHTTNIEEDIPELVYAAVGQIKDQFETQANDFELFQGRFLTTEEAERHMIAMVRAGVITPSKLDTVISEWDTPRHPEFEDEANMWRLFNAVTQSYKPTGKTDNINTLVHRSPLLMEYCREAMI